MNEIGVSMADEITKKHWYSNFPKWLKIILLVISILTGVYWIGFCFYKILCAIRVIGAFVFDKRNYWTFLTCIFILVIGGLLLGQFYFDLNPFGKFSDWLVNGFNSIRNEISNLIKG